MQIERAIRLFLTLGKALMIFIGGGVVFHVFVMTLDYYLMIKPLYIDLHGNFLRSIFSVPMLPMVAAYGLCSLLMYLLWKKKKKAILFAREKEIQSEKVEAVFKSMQRLTGILAEHIAVNNAEIINWIEIRKRKGRPVSAKVVDPSHKIADALQSLSEISFVFPYTEKRPKNFIDIEAILQEKLHAATPELSRRLCRAE